MANLSAIGNFTSLGAANPWSGLISAGGQIGSGIIGSNASSNAANAQVSGYNQAIGTQQNTLGNISSLYAPQYQTGVGANQNLQSVLGLNGAAPNYSLFQNAPGYQFSLQQADNALNRQASAAGNAYSTNTLANLGQLNAGYASQNYNNYVSQLMGAANLGQQANQGLQQANQAAGNNISQAQIGIGSANASGILGASGANQSILGGGLNALGQLLGGGANGSGVLSQGSSLYNSVSNLFGGGSSAAGAGLNGSAGAYSGLTTSGGVPYFLAGDSGAASSAASGAGLVSGSDVSGAAASGVPDWLSGFGSASGQAAGDAGAAGSAAGSGGGSALGALGAAAIPASIFGGVALGGLAAFNHNSIVSNEDMIGNFNQAAATAAASGDQDSANLYTWLAQQYGNNQVSAEYNTNTLGPGGSMLYGSGNPGGVLSGQYDRNQINQS